MPPSMAELTGHVVGLQQLVGDLRRRLELAEGQLSKGQPVGQQAGGGKGWSLLNPKCLWPGEYKDGMVWQEWVDEFMLYVGAINTKAAKGMTFAAYHKDVIADEDIPVDLEDAVNRFGPC